MAHEFQRVGQCRNARAFPPKSAGRRVHGDRAKRYASDPFTPRMMAVAAKTAKNTSASAKMVVQKTPK
jgi:hypothetical protein